MEMSTIRSDASDAAKARMAARVRPLTVPSGVAVIEAISLCEWPA